MTNNAFMAILKELQEKEEEILNNRAELYSTNKDRMHNFKAIGSRLKMKPSFVAFTLMHKQLIALGDWLAEYDERILDSIDLDEFKKIEEWIIDIRNYLSLIYAMLYEEVEVDE